MNIIFDYMLKMQKYLKKVFVDKFLISDGLMKRVGD